MTGKALINAVAKAMYDSHQFKKPWDHPDTVEKWHPWMTRQAAAMVKTYEGLKKAKGKRA
jgi:hypothetical protein